MAVDLPAFERPTKQTSGAPGSGSCSNRAAEVKKEARCKMDTANQYKGSQTLLYNQGFGSG